MIEKLIAEAREQATWDIPESTEILLLKMADALEKKKPKTPTTNYERIKELTINEMAVFIARLQYEPVKQAADEMGVKAPSFEEVIEKELYKVVDYLNREWKRGAER